MEVRVVDAGVVGVDADVDVHWVRCGNGVVDTGTVL